VIDQFFLCAGRASLNGYPVQIRDVLPAEPDALAAVAAQITELALERANDNQAKQTEALQNALSTRDAQAAELQVCILGASL